MSNEIEIVKRVLKEDIEVLEALLKTWKPLIDDSSSQQEYDVRKKQIKELKKVLKSLEDGTK